MRSDDIQVGKEKKFLTDSVFDKLQEIMNSINPPARIGRIPYKVSAGSAGFTAEQWMLWTILYSPFVPRDFLRPLQHYTLWCTFSKACALLCRPYIHEAEVDKADELLLSFCTGFEQLYGQEACTPNIHMHCHLKECVLDVGPLHSFWCFSFERYNGILENMKISWHAPEVQLIHKFSSLQALAGAVLPEDAPVQLLQCFNQAKEYKTALPDPDIDSVSVLKYEQHFMCLPKDICALQLPFHHPVPPGRERFMMDFEREKLWYKCTVPFMTLKVSNMYHFAMWSFIKFGFLNNCIHPQDQGPIALLQLLPFGLTSQVFYHQDNQVWMMSEWELLSILCFIHPL